MQRGNVSYPEPPIPDIAAERGPQMQLNLNISPGAESNTSLLTQLRMDDSATQPILHKVPTHILPIKVLALSLHVEYISTGPNHRF